MAKPPSWLKSAGLALALCGLTASATKIAQATSGYLTAVGPAPLRFQPIAAPQAPIPLPSLTQTKKDALQPATESTNAPAASAGLTGYAPLLREPSASSEPGAPEDTAGLSLPPITGRSDAAANAAINPQSVLGYLVPLPTNTPAGQFLAPAFVPPMAPSSKATYESR